MPTAMMPPNSENRVAWVDYAKGFCIIMVVMMHSTLGVGDAMGGKGFLHPVVAFALPFRMPDFFVIAGLFLSQTINRDWRTFIDRKVIHFGYFYLLWLAIQVLVKYARPSQDGTCRSIASIWASASSTRSARCGSSISCRSSSSRPSCCVRCRRFSSGSRRPCSRRHGFQQAGWSSTNLPPAMFIFSRAICSPASFSCWRPGPAAIKDAPPPGSPSGLVSKPL